MNLFLVDFEDDQTTVKQLNNDEITEMLDFGVDIFFNEKWFNK